MTRHACPGSGIARLDVRGGSFYSTPRQLENYQMTKMKEFERFDEYKRYKKILGEIFCV